jgi:hypothetical protein
MTRVTNDAGDFVLTKIPDSLAMRKAWRSLCVERSQCQGHRAEALVPLVVASLLPYERRALDRDFDLKSAILSALGVVVSPLEPRTNELLLVAARNLLRSDLRKTRAKKRRAKTVSLDDADAPIVIADMSGSPLDWLIAHETVDAHHRAPVPSVQPKPLARANQRLRQKKRALRTQ